VVQKSGKIVSIFTTFKDIKTTIYFTILDLLYHLFDEIDQKLTIFIHLYKRRLYNVDFRMINDKCNEA